MPKENGTERKGRGRRGGRGSRGGEGGISSPPLKKGKSVLVRIKLLDGTDCEVACSGGKNFLFLSLFLSFSPS